MWPASSNSLDQQRAPDIEPRGTGAVGHIGHVSAGQIEIQIGGGQQNLGHPRVVIRFMRPHPFEFRRGKAGKNDIAGKRPHAGCGIEAGRLSMAAGVVPENARADHLTCRIQKCGAVHVPGNTDALQPGKLRMQRLQRGNGRLKCRNPRRRVLFRPAGVRMRHRVMAFRRPDGFTILANQQGSETRSAEVYAKIGHAGAPLRVRLRDRRR